MQEIEKMEAGKIYLIESTASANSVYFETDYLAKLFFKYCDYYLKDYLHVQEYILNENGWAMLIKIRSAQTIRKYYTQIEAKRASKKINLEHREPRAIWWILSERVRLFISTYVRMSNYILRREGSLVRRKYGRYQFDNLIAAQNYVAKIRKNKHEMQQSKDRYQGFKDHFHMSGNFLTNPLKSSLWVEICDVKELIYEKIAKIFGEEMPVLHGLGNLVEPKLHLENSAVKSPPTKPPKP